MRGQELYVYPPDTFLKPILVVSHIQGETAICFSDALNPSHLLNEGMKDKSTDWILITSGEPASQREFDNIVSSLKLDKITDVLEGRTDASGWDYYVELWSKYCNKRKAV